jgi:hypothetical protein
MTYGLKSDSASLRWITITTGQRAIRVEQGIPMIIIVRDFNPSVHIHPYTVCAGRPVQLRIYQMLVISYLNLIPVPA